MAGRPPLGKIGVLAEVTGLGLEVAVAFGIPAYAGYRIDAALGTAPWAILAGSVVGMCLAAAALWKTAKRLEGSSHE